MKKSQFVQFLLTLFFGPLGLFYSSVAAAIAMILAGVVFGVLTVGIALLVIWPLSILIGVATVSRHNARAGLDARRHEELVRAVGFSQTRRP